ncbi:MAG TPA: peptide ABC transporter substrate-binding protein [Ktedonobacteraceae bacterium]|nr:peptide ABC transporter substrate-binding protein [Ktedonobacteraceae bacterium]
MHQPRKPRLLMLAFSCIATLAIILSACGAPSTTNQQGNAGGTPVKGGTWVDDLYEEPASLIPNGVAETFAVMVDNAIWAPLFYGNAEGAITPGLVTQVPTLQNGGISQDLKTWKFTLRSGLKWSDGQTLDARDVDFTWKLWMNPKFTPAYTIGYNLITGTDISPDNLTITFHLKQAFAPFLSIWTDGGLAPMPAHVFSSMAPDKILSSAENLKPSVSSGPFTMTESKAGSNYTVSRNPNYYRASEGLPYLDKVVFRVVTDQNTILKDLQAGTINSSWFLDVTKTAAYQKLSNYKLSFNPHASNFEALYFNFKNKVLADNVEVRQAIAMAIDHDALITTARRGQAVKLCTDHGQAYVPGYQADAPCPKYDPDGAKALLTSHGWTAGKDGVMTKNGQRLEFQYSTTANNYWRADDELIIQANLQAIGIQIDISNYPASTFFGTFLPSGVVGKYDLAEFENSYTYDADNSSAFACSQIPPAGSNYAFYCNPDLDKLFEQEQATADPTARQQIFNQIHQIELTDFPFVTLYSPTDISMQKLTGHNYNPGPMGASETVGIWEWWCTNGQC